MITADEARRLTAEARAKDRELPWLEDAIRREASRYDGSEIAYVIVPYRCAMDESIRVARRYGFEACDDGGLLKLSWRKT